MTKSRNLPVEDSGSFKSYLQEIIVSGRLMARRILPAVTGLIFMEFDLRLTRYAVLHGRDRFRLFYGIDSVRNSEPNRIVKNSMSFSHGYLSHISQSVGDYRQHPPRASRPCGVIFPSRPPGIRCPSPIICLSIAGYTGALIASGSLHARF